jgi:hypothetical protein
MTFRLRCVLPKQLVMVIEALGTRPVMPSSLKESSNIYGWLTKDFLNTKEFTMNAGGVNYTCSNLPVVIGLIVHLLDIKVIEIEGDIFSQIDAKGTLKRTPIPKSVDVRDDFPLMFRLNLKQVEVLPFADLVCFLSYGCSPFDQGKISENNQHKVFLELERKVTATYPEVVNPIIKAENWTEKTVKEEKPLVETGFLNATDLKPLRGIIALDDEDEKVFKLLHFLKSRELRSLNLAANLRLHITMLEKKQEVKKTATPTEGAVHRTPMGTMFASSAIATPSKPVAPLNTLCDEMSSFEYLRETKPSEHGTKKREKTYFLESLQTIGRELQKMNGDLVVAKSFDTSLKMETLWQQAKTEETNQEPLQIEENNVTFITQADIEAHMQVVANQVTDQIPRKKNNQTPDAQGPVLEDASNVDQKALAGEDEADQGAILEEGRKRKREESTKPGPTDLDGKDQEGTPVQDRERKRKQTKLNDTKDKEDRQSTDFGHEDDDESDDLPIARLGDKQPAAVRNSARKATKPDVSEPTSPNDDTPPYDDNPLNASASLLITDYSETISPLNSPKMTIVTHQNRAPPATTIRMMVATEDATKSASLPISTPSEQTPEEEKNVKKELSAEMLKGFQRITSKAAAKDKKPPPTKRPTPPPKPKSTRPPRILVRKPPVRQTRKKPKKK